MEIAEANRPRLMGRRYHDTAYDTKQKITFGVMGIDMDWYGQNGACGGVLNENLIRSSSWMKGPGVVLEQLMYCAIDYDTKQSVPLLENCGRGTTSA